MVVVVFELHQLVGVYALWFLGAGKMTPITAAGYIGNSTVEILVVMLFISVGIASFVAVGLSLWGLRRSE